MRIYKRSTIVLFALLIIGAFLRLYRLDELMPFIADQGWFYIQARDMLFSGEIPLVGITSSHAWLHQGAYWTYILGFIFGAFGFNPVLPSYFTAFLGIGTIYFVYRFVTEMVSKRVALVSALIYATSPLVIADSRMAYHTSPIPLLTILLIYATFRLVKGKVLFLPFCILLLVLLYNFEIATFSLSVAFFLILSLGIVKKESWAKNVFKVRIIFLSMLAFFIPMFPMLTYDMSRDFPQTLKFLVWMFYRIAVFLGFPPLNPNAPYETWGSFLTFFSSYMQKLIFLPSREAAFLIFIFALIYLSYKALKSVNKSGIFLIFTFTIVPLLGYIAAKTNSSAYLSILYPQVAIILSLLWNFIFYPRWKYIGFVLLVLFSVANGYFMVRQNFLVGPTFKQRVDAAKKIIELSDGRPYNVLGKGQGSQYESFVTPHQYLLWWLGSPVSEKKEKVIFYVSEYPDRIEIEVNK